MGPTILLPEYPMTESLPLPAAVFKAYDIRGTVPGQINEPFAHRLGLALAAMARREGVHSLAIGHDGRLSSPGLAHALISGLHAGGINTVDLGLVHTPLVYYAAFRDGSGSGVAVTGSHNPPDYNGFKMMMAGRTLHGDEIQSLRDTMDGILPPPDATAGISIATDLVDTYIQEIAGHVRLARPMHIAIDCGNGVGGVAAARLFRALGCTVDELYCDVDGLFPNHHPELPFWLETVSALKSLTKLCECCSGCNTRKPSLLTCIRCLMAPALTKPPAMCCRLKR